MSAPKDYPQVSINLIRRQMVIKALIGTTQHTLVAQESSAKELIKAPKLRNCRGNPLGPPPSLGALYYIAQ